MQSKETPLDTCSPPLSDASGPLPSPEQNNEKRGPSVDMFLDEQYALPFHIKQETFPVPNCIPGDPSAVWLPGKRLRLAYVSWNMGHKDPNLAEVANHCIHPNAHIIAVCTQENGTSISSGKQQRQWSKYVEETCLGGEYTLVGQGKLWYAQLLVFARKRDVAQRVCHVEVSSVKTGVKGLGGNKGGVGIALMLSMKVHPDLQIQEKGQLDISPASSPQLAEGKGNVFDPGVSFGTPSSTTVSAPYFTILFIGAHLAAHHEAVELRNKDYHTIVRSLRVGCRGEKRKLFKNLLMNEVDCVLDEDAGEECDHVGDANGAESNRKCSVAEGEQDDELDVAVMRVPLLPSKESTIDRDVTEEFDLTFFGGDLNYRINGTRKAIEHIITRHKDIRSILVHNDQLNLEKAKGVVFHGFLEGNLFFRPTYKYEIHNKVTINEYDFSTEKNRMPAYCDRVLYKKRKQSRAGKIKIRLYTDVAHVRTSDHRPVVAMFDVSTEAYH